jgi:hypothetical protein
MLLSGTIVPVVIRTTFPPILAKFFPFPTVDALAISPFSVLSSEHRQPYNSNFASPDNTLYNNTLY